MNATYLAFVLDIESRNYLLKRFPPKNERVVTHHITIEFANVTKAMIAEFMGGNIQVAAVEYVESDGLDCFVVLVNGQTTRPDEGTYNITHSLAPGRKPVESNSVIKNRKSEQITQCDIVLTGSVQLIPK